MRTKSATLNYLRDKVKGASILNAVIFTAKRWNINEGSCCAEIIETFPNSNNLIVRSSSRSEDQFSGSAAGKYDSILDVRPENVKEAIEKVLASYGNNVSPDDEVLIQPMLQNVAMSGVLFTKDPNTGASYYIINYDLNGDTSAVTSGRYSGHTFIIAHACHEIANPKFKKLIQFSKELEELLENPNLDIEFAFDRNNELYLFQVRPLIIKNQCQVISQKEIINKMRNKIRNIGALHPYLHGTRTILGVMPDWNPAEIIGIRPKPLALSIYKELITDSIWAYQRDNYGYKNLRSFPLLIDLMGLPYIDVRVSFNSFVPKSLDSNIAEKLVNYYLNRLEKEPNLHDKVEFEIVFSCYTFDLNNRIRLLSSFGFDEDEITTIINVLRNLTNNIIHRDNGLWLTDIGKIEELNKRHKEIYLNEDFDDLTKIYWLIEDCKRYGTLPFAGLARAGFIAVQLLNSMVSIGILTEDERLNFLNSLDSVSTKMNQDLQCLDKEQFLSKYGHLRPGTYDILSPRYDETPDLYFDWDKIKKNSLRPKEEFRLTLSQMKEIENLLEHHNLDYDVVGLFSFIKAAIEGREYSKFVFTKTLSDVLNLLKKFAKKHFITLEDISYMDIQKFLKMHSTSWDVLEEVKSLIEQGKKKYEITKQLNLPSIITKETDVEAFYLSENKPNFITRKKVTGHVVTDLSNPNMMQDAIIFIRSADPGFDWIFTYEIAGFITAYGGINSHMAIRAGELGLPAVIGAGEKLYNQWKQAHRIYVDCCNQHVEILH